MGPVQIVFLFDLNACVDFLSRPKEELGKILLSIRLACLRLLSDFAAKSSSIKWGFKFFDSSGSKTQIMCRFSFPDMSLEHFETFENEICVRYERHLSILQAYKESSKDSGILSKEKTEEESSSDLPVRILQLALTQLLCEFQWESMEMWSPSISKMKNRKRNFLFVVSDFKDNDETLFKYFGLNSLLSKSKFLNLFLPQSLRDSILKKSDINLIFINTCQDQNFMGCSSKILPVLADSLRSIQGSLIPLNILSQPLYNISLNNSKISAGLADVPCTYFNSFIPFSAVFEQSLLHPFYLADNSSVSECIIDIPSQSLQISIKVIEIMNKENNLKTTSTVKNKWGKDSKNVWSKFTAQCAVSRNIHFPAYKSILCLPNSKKAKMEENSTLSAFNKTLCIHGVNLLLECETRNGLKMPGLFIALSNDTAAVSVLDPAINFPNLAIDFALPVTKSLINKDSINGNLMKVPTFVKKETDLFSNNQIGVTALKPFYMECLDPWFKPKKLSGVASYIESKSSKKKRDNVEIYKKLLKESVKSDNNSKSKKDNLSKGIPEQTNVDKGEIKQETLQDHQPNPESDTNNLEESASDMNDEELLSHVKDAYESSLEATGNIVSTSKQIVRMITNFCKKNFGAFFEENANKLFKENFWMSDKKIMEKYAMSDSAEAIEKKIKEFQMQILLILEVESMKMSPDKTNCVSDIIPLLRLATLSYIQKDPLKGQLEGIKELKTFFEEIIKKNYSHTLYDILVEIGNELDYIQGSDDSESSDSPTETILSESNIEDDLFSSVISSAMSEKSISSTGSQRDCKDNKERNNLGRKLIRRRSDLSETSKYREVLLPKSSPKKKKAKRTANVAVKYSPRLAAKRKEPVKPLCEKNKARRNLFSGEKSFLTPKKSVHQPSTPKSKKKNTVIKMKLAAETPSHKQNYSALQRRKSFIDHLSQSPKVIAESPTVDKTMKDNTCKDLYEKLQKASQEASNLSNKTIEEEPRKPSLKEYTPESKRRLSLKLFSKLLCSPTARMGIKKCTKRLFDQISPQKTDDDSKRQKVDYE